MKGKLPVDIPQKERKATPGNLVLKPGKHKIRVCCEIEKFKMASNVIEIEIDDDPLKLRD